MYLKLKFVQDILQPKMNFFADFKERYKLYAVAINFDIEVGENETLKEYLISLGLYDRIMNLPQITKEQFYDLTVPTE